MFQVSSFRFKKKGSGLRAQEEVQDFRFKKSGIGSRVPGTGRRKMPQRNVEFNSINMLNNMGEVDIHGGYGPPYFRPGYACYFYPGYAC